LAGLSQTSGGSIQINNRVIAKCSRKEVALKFLQPADQHLVSQLLADGKITDEQARLSQFVPMADDVTVEADSGGHTDNRPLVSILPAIIQLRMPSRKNTSSPSPPGLVLPAELPPLLQLWQRL